MSLVDVWLINDLSFDQVSFIEKELKRFPEVMRQEINKYFRPKDRLQRLLARCIIELYFKEFNIPFSWDDWRVDVNGKPSLHPSVRFSISHSGDMVGVAFFNQNIGFDIECVTEGDHVKLLPYFHPKEIEYIQNSNYLNQTFFNPNYALELRYEGQKCNKISRFIDFSIAPLW